MIPVGFFEVRRLKTDCCGMKVGEIYPAKAVCVGGGPYVECLLPDGTLTSPHFVGSKLEWEWFEEIKK